MKNLNEQLEINNELINSLLEENQAILDEYLDYSIDYDDLLEDTNDDMDDIKQAKKRFQENIAKAKKEHEANSRQRQRLADQLRQNNRKSAEERAKILKRDDNITKGALIIGGVAIAAGLAAVITATAKRFKKKREAFKKYGDQESEIEALKAKLTYMQEIKKAGEKTNKLYEKAGKQSKADTNQQKIDEIEERIKKTKEQLKNKNK